MVPDSNLEALVESWDSAKGCFGDFPPLTLLVGVVHPPGAPGCRSSGRDNSSVEVVHLQGEYFEARALFCFVLGTRRVCVLSGPGPRWRQLLCSRCTCHAVPRLGSRPCFPWPPRGAPFEGSRPAPMLRRSASKGSALLCRVVSQHGDRGHLSFVGSRAITGSPSLRPSTGLKLGARRSYK